jgi:hypothetical protein
VGAIDSVGTQAPADNPRGKLEIFHSQPIDWRTTFQSLMRHTVSPIKRPCIHIRKGYKTLRRSLRVRQNPPACAPYPCAISFSFHCPSVVGFSSSVGISKVHEQPSSQVVLLLHLMVVVRRAHSCAPALLIPPVY